MPVFIAPSFAKGELAPSLYGRVDTAAYQIGLRTARNMIIHPYGGASNRAGLSFIGPAAAHTYAPRLVPFEYRTTDAYVIEFGSLYARFIRNDAYVVEDPVAITGVTAANPGVVTAVAHGYSNGDEVYISGIVGMTRLNGRRFIVANKTNDTFELTDQVTGANFSTAAFAAYSSGGTVERVYEIATPYLSEHLDELKWTQSADVMTLTHRLYPPQELSRTDHDAWTLAVPDFAPAIAFPTGAGVTVTTTGSESDRYQVTTIARDTLEESLPGLNSTTRTITGITKANPAVVTATSHGFSNGDEVHIAGIVGMTELNGRRFRAQNVTTHTFELEDENSSTYTTYSSGGTANQTFVRVTNSATTKKNTVAWTAVAGALKYAVYRESNGIFGLIGETELVSFADENIEPDVSITPPKARNPFRTAGNYPGTASYYEQRRAFGGSTNKPDTTEYSQVGNQANMSRSSPLQESDAFAATLTARQVNEIRHFVPGNDLLVLTSGSEWRVNSGGDAGFSATSVKQKPQSFWGASHDIPIVSGNTTLFVEESRAKVRSLGYSLQIDGYTGTDLNLLSNHLLYDTTVADWAFARSPDSIVHIARSDGKALALTFQQEQEVIAWTRWDTLGKFERVAVIKHADGEREDQVYFVVKRKINGQTVRYIEKLHSRIFSDVRDCFFVDCGLSLDSPVAITGITSADPVVVTAVAHGFSNGDEVDIFDVEWEPEFDDLDNESQPDQLNGRRYIVANKTTDTFELTTSAGDVDGTAFAAYVEGGTVRKAVLTVSGIDHLEGREVSILADGNVVSGKTVTDGAVTLPRKASRVHLGLKYISDLETLNIEVAGAATLQGQPKKVNAVTVRFEKSRGLFIGPTFERLTEMKQRQFEAMGDPTAFLTGDKKVTIESDWNTNGRICLRQRYPLPMSVLAIIPDTTLGGTSRDD